MAYARSGPQDEVSQLRDEITHEVNADSEHLAHQIFPRKGKQPDMARVPQGTIESHYRQAYLNQDRKYLLSEAQRDPDQFIEVSRRIGVKLPEEIGQDQAVASPTLPQPAPPAAPATLPMPPSVPLPPGPEAAVTSLPLPGPVVAPAIAPPVPGGV